MYIYYFSYRLSTIHEFILSPLWPIFYQSPTLTSSPRRVSYVMSSVNEKKINAYKNILREAKKSMHEKREFPIKFQTWRFSQPRYFDVKKKKRIYYSRNFFIINLDSELCVQWMLTVVKYSSLFFSHYFRSETNVMLPLALFSLQTRVLFYFRNDTKERR